MSSQPELAIGRSPSRSRGDGRAAAVSWLLAPRHGAFIAVATYLVASLLFFGKALLPHPGNTCLCIPTDPEIYMWGYKWWPYALTHGLNPFSTHLIEAPYGANLAQSTVLPGPAFVMWPVTAAFGPVVAFNVSELLAPALAGWTTFLLCRRLIGGAPVPGEESARAQRYRRAFWPAFVGGWLFAFSSYMIGQLEGHENLVLVFLIPALAHLLVRTHAGELSRRRAATCIALCLIGEFSISTEVFATFTIAAVVTLLAVGFVGDAATRRRLRSTLITAVIAYVAAVIVCSPYIYYQLKPGGTPVDLLRARMFSGDLLALVVPTPLTRIAGSHFAATSARFTAGAIEGGDYVGIFLLALLALGVVWGWRRRDIRVLAVVGIVETILSFGSRLHVDGHLTSPLPWWVLERLPLLGLVLPCRQIVFVWLAVAVTAALALARARYVWRRSLLGVLAVLAIACLWPAVGRGSWHAPLVVPPVFTSAADRHVLHPNANVAVVPIADSTLADLWQAEDDFRFRLVGGYVLPPEAGSPYEHWPIYATLAGLPAIPGADAAARDFFGYEGIGQVVVADANVPGSPWPTILRQLGWRVQQVGGVLVFTNPAGP